MAVTDPFPLNIELKVDSPELTAWLAQNGRDKFANAEDINKILIALDYLRQNIGGGAVNSVNGLDGDVVLNGSNIYATNPSTLAQEPIDDILEIFHENLADKVDKITGKGLSEENYTSTEKSKLASITDSVKQKTINTSRSALASDNGCLIKIKGNATYTIDQATLPTGWNVIVRTFAGATCTLVASAGTTFDAPTGLILNPLKMCSIIKDSDDNKILINGETSLT